MGVVIINGTAYDCPNGVSVRKGVPYDAVTGERLQPSQDQDRATHTTGAVIEGNTGPVQIGNGIQINGAQISGLVIGKKRKKGKK